LGASTPSFRPSAAWAAGPPATDTIVLIALNLNIDTEWSGRDPEGIKSYDPVDATVTLDLPEWIGPAEVFTVHHTGLADLPAARNGRMLTFDLSGLAVQKVIVITADPAVRTQMQAINDQMRERLQAMERHVPVPLP